MISFFEIIYWIKGHPIKRIERFKNYDKQAQEANLIKIANIHFKNTLAYAELLDFKGPISLSDLPVISKSHFQKGLSIWTAANFKKRSVYINSTSGSSGIPLRFIKNWECHAKTWSLYYSFYNQHDISVFTDLEARFYGIPQDNVVSRLKEKLKDRILVRRRFPVFNLSDDVLDKYYQYFAHQGFVYLNGYASSLLRFAEFLIEKSLVLKDVCPTLKLCITTSEMCSDSDRTKMEKGFGVKVVNEYGSAEFGIVAFEDTDGQFILNDTNLFVEIVNDDNLPVPDGEEGKIIITSIDNRAMPFIRFEIGDRGIIDKRRKNGKRVLQKLTGRVNDFAVLSSKKCVPGLTFYYITKSLLQEEGLVKELVVKQTDIDTFCVVYCSKEKLSYKYENKVKLLFSTYIEKDLNVSFRHVDYIKRQPSGKLKQFEKLVF